MSEATPEAAPATETTEAAPATTPEQPAQQPAPEQPKPTETVDFWKQKAREQESRAKANADAARKLQELEDSQKSEAQKIADRATAAERERDEARAEGLRYKAAAKFGVAEDYFDLLGSGDEETIAGRAERVGSLLKVAAENEQLKAELEALRAGRPSPATGRPVAALRPGATPAEVQPEPQDSYPADFLPRRMRERLAGPNT